MSEKQTPTALKRIGFAVQKHSPEILTGLGIAGMITAAIMAVKATPKAMILIKEKKEQKYKECEPILDYSIPLEGLDENELMHLYKLTPIEIIKSTFVCYIPAVVTGFISILCLIGANSVNAKRNAALATVYTISETALKEYQGKVIEAIGEKKEQAIKDMVAKDKIDKAPVSSKEVIVTEKGNTLCYDAVSGRYFKSDIDKIKKVENELNRRMLDEMYISLNDFYYELGLTNTRLGDELGWNIDKGFIDLQFSSQLSDDGTPCLVIDYRIAPRYDFSN